MPPMKVVGQFTVESAIAVIKGTTDGVLAVGGEVYSHVMLAVGFQANPGGNNGNPLTYVHQVGVYSAVKGNAFASGADSYVIGFECAIGQQAGSGTLEQAVAYLVAQYAVTSGSTVERVFGHVVYATESAGTIANVAICDYVSSFTVIGDWFVYNGGTRPSHFGGPVEFADGIEIAGDSVLPEEFRRDVTNSFVRIAAGNSGTPGANFLMFGPTHATNPNEAILSAGVITLGNGASALSFYGVSATSRQLLATGAAHSVDDVITVLQTLGLVKQS